MRIGIVGGIERGWTNYERLARDHGHEVEFHGGHMHGRGQETLESLVQRVDLVVIVTQINSHGAVQQARRLARRYERRELIVRSLGMAKFGGLIAACDAQVARQGRMAAAG